MINLSGVSAVARENPHITIISWLRISGTPTSEAKQGKRILIPQQMEEVVIVPPCFEAFPVDTSF
jgi:hypothetical protein